MSPQAVADQLVALGFTPTLDGDDVYLDEEVWTLSDGEGAWDEVWDRYAEIRAHLNRHGLDMPLGRADIGRGFVWGVVVPLTT